MWDHIEATEGWVDSQVPEIIKFIFENDIATVENRYQKQLRNESLDYTCVSLCYVNIYTGAMLSLGYKFAGTGNRDAFMRIMNFT